MYCVFFLTAFAASSKPRTIVPALSTTAFGLTMHSAVSRVSDVLPAVTVAVPLPQNVRTVTPSISPLPHDDPDPPPLADSEGLELEPPDDAPDDELPPDEPPQPATASTGTARSAGATRRQGREDMDRPPPGQGRRGRPPTAARRA